MTWHFKFSGKEKDYFNSLTLLLSTEGHGLGENKKGHNVYFLAREISIR